MQISRKQDIPHSKEFNKKNVKIKKDIYKDTPVRYLGFTNELGTAVKEICTGANGIVKHLPALSYIPALGYIACDVADKYKKGEDGTGKKPSIRTGARELISQVTTSVLAPTGVVVATQKATKAVAKKAAPKLPEKLVTAFTKNGGRAGKIATVGVSLVALTVASKPIDKVTEKVFEKTVDPLLGIHKNNCKNNQKSARTLDKTSFCEVLVPVENSNKK